MREERQLWSCKKLYSFHFLNYYRIFETQEYKNTIDEKYKKYNITNIIYFKPLLYSSLVTFSSILTLRL